MTLYQASITVYRARLNILTGLLTKAEAHAEGNELLQAKLSDDMHPLATQIRFVANLPGEALPRITARAFTSVEEDPVTWSEAKALVAKMAELLDEIRPEELVASDKELRLEIPNGIQFTLSAEDYVRDWSLPNFYFHLTTAYAILRQAGVEIGKADFMQHMAAYVTQTPTPTA